MDYQKLEAAVPEHRPLDSEFTYPARKPRSRRLLCVGSWILGIAGFFLFLFLAHIFFDLTRFILTVTHTIPATAEELEAQNHLEYGSRRVKLRMGPFHAPGIGSGMNMIDHLTLMPPPCTDCVITYMQAGLEYEDGSIADTDTGLWLHHGVLSNINEMSITCPNEVEKIFASGNERVPLDLTDNGKAKTGYYFGYPLHLGMGLELMNDNVEDTEVYFTMIFEYVPEPTKSGFTKSVVVWLDVGGCSGKHEVEAKDEPSFSYDSFSWTSVSTTGRVLLTAGHLHDAGANITLLKNEKSVCDMVTSYGTVDEKFGRKLEARHMDHMDMDMDMGMDMDMEVHVNLEELKHMEHIVDMTQCANHMDLAVDDTLYITATYDTADHPLQLEANGMVGELMGITMVYVDTGDVVG